MDDLKQSTLLPILKENIASEAVVYTDEAGQFRNLKREFADHDFTFHGKGEYVRGAVHTNTIEGYFSIFKRGMKGVYQHCGRQHLHRYAAEFEFRYNNRAAHEIDDTIRANAILKGPKASALLIGGLTHGRVPDQVWSRKGFQRFLAQLLQQQKHDG